MLLALLAPAHASCAVDQRTEGSTVHVRIQALDEPVGCRTVSLAADGPITLEAALRTPEDRRVRLKDDHFRPLPGGGWEVGAPELEVGGTLELEAEVAGLGLTVRLAPAPETWPAVRSVEEVHTLTLDPKHPGWGFADPKRGSTRVELTISLEPSSVPQLWPLPAAASAVDSGGLPVVPMGVTLPAGSSEAKIAYTVPGAAAQGRRTVLPGTLTLRGAGVSWVASNGTVTTDEARFTAPGPAAWRVASVGGDAVIPDVDTFVAGLAYRFAQASLPEPAVPTDLRGDRDRERLLGNILSVVRDLRPGSLPGADPLHPRQLNQAWRSDWATPVEKGLILHRMLGQERYRPGWVLTGTSPDLNTLTGFETVLVTVRVDGEIRWIDPACTVCGPGEISTRWMGHLGVGIDVASADEDPRPGAGLAPYTTEVPTAPGRLTRSLALVGDRFHARFHAVGAAALWLREQLVGVDPALRPGRLATVLGMPDGTLVSAEGLGEAGAPVSLELDGPRAPEDPFPTDETPWAGGWGDALE